MKAISKLFLQWAGFLLLWLLFVFQFTANEILVGAAASALSVLALQTVLRCVPLCFQPRLRWIAQAWRLPGMILPDIWILVKDLAGHVVHKPFPGVLEVQRFRAPGESCRASGKRALAVLFLTTTPNSVVLDIDRESGNMLVHQLSPSPIPKLMRKLEE